MPVVHEMSRFLRFIILLFFVGGLIVSSGVGCGQIALTPEAVPAASTTPSAVTTSTPTVALNDSKIIQQTTKRAGINLGSINYYDTGQLLKNLVGSMNPGFEPVISQQIWAVGAAGTTTTFTDPDIYDTVPANYWAGGTFTVIDSQSEGAELGCTGTIASNTGPNYPKENNTSPVFTMSKGCSAPFSIGDIVIFNKTFSPTPESWWENSQAGFWMSVSGGGKLLSDTTDLCSKCGTQALQMNVTATGSSATVNGYYDSANTENLFVLMNGTYQISFWAKAAAGSPTLSVSAARLSAGGFSCGTYTPALTSTWTQFTYTCKASETQGTAKPGTAQLSFNASGGAVDVDNVDFEKTGGNAANTTVFRDEVINALTAYYSTASGGNGGMLRDWLNQNGETIDNWTQPDYARKPTVGGALYFDGPNGSGSLQLSLEDYLVICQLLHAEPYLEVPVTFTTNAAASLIEFLGGAATTTYGARRSALGQTNPWTSVFKQIHLSFCNECWNAGTFPGQSLGWRNTQPANELLYDYSIRARDIFSAMRASSSYNASAFDLVMNAQTAVNWAMDNEIARARPDSIELEDYLYGTVNEFSTDALLWGPAMVEPYDKVVDPNDPSNFYTSVKDYQGQKTCGASGSATCAVNIYEWGQGTVNGTIDQTHIDYINAGAGEGVVAVLEPLLNLQYFGILNNSYFALAEFNNGTSNGTTAKLWGNTVDMGGATNNKRPQFLALSLLNQSVIGPMYSCPISNNYLYNFAGNSSNGTSVPPGIPELNSVPYLYAFCFQNGNNRSLILINTDLTNSHSLAFSGTHTPTGTVVQRQYAPSGLDNMNESHTGTLTNTTKATVALTTTTLSNPASLTLPPYSVTALDYTTNGSSESAGTATPSISPAGGSYTAPVSVTISDSTSGASIYYTTNGGTPTTSSQRYVGPITVSSTATVRAIAVAGSSTSGAVASATYTITPVVSMPAFSPAGGSYTGAQSVSISDATKGATIYYTTNGTAPTTSSTKYTKAVTVSSSETLQTIAVLAGYTSSKIASATYTIGSSSAGLPNFSSGFTSTMLASNGSTTVTKGALQLTAGELNQVGSAWYAVKVPIGSFTSDFTFQLLNAVADGFTFTIQNAVDGTAALGGDRLDLGYGGIGKSVALKFDLYNNAGEGADSTGTYLNGATPTMPATDLSSAGIDLHTGDIFHAHVVYDGNTLTLSLTDTNTGATATRQFGINIPATVGANTAYVGFTGSTGGYASTQQILTWTYSNTTNPIGATPTFSPASGTYGSTQSVSITDPIHGAKIYYTTDGSTPTSSSAIYQKAFSVTSTETIHAIAVVSGYTNSDIASAAYVIGSSSNLPSYPLGMSSSMLALNGSAAVENGGLWLTSGSLLQAGSAWYSAKVPITTFSSDFIFQLLNPVADGFTFTIQGDSAGTATLGTNGDGLGYADIGKSVGLKFDLFNNAGEGPDSTGIYLNGATPTVPASDLSSNRIDLHSGDIFHAQVVYDGTTLTLTLTDTRTGAIATQKFTVNIPNAVGGNSAYVGFTGSTGGYAAAQEILNWTFSNVVGQTTVAANASSLTSGGQAKALSIIDNASASSTIAAVASHTGGNDITSAANTIGTSTTSSNLLAGSSGISSAMLSTNGTAVAENRVIQLTSGKSMQVGSAWYTVKVPVDHFSTDFSFRMLNAAENGLTFTLQNDNSGIWALGHTGDKLGYAGIGNSFALHFNFDKGISQASSPAGMYMNGVEPDGMIFNLNSGGIKLGSGDVFHVHVAYDDNTLSLTLTNTKTGASYIHKVPINIPAIVGSNTAYVGFTGGTGVASTTHQVLNWTFSNQ